MPASSRALLLSAAFALSASLTSALPWSGPAATASYAGADYNPRPTSSPHVPAPLAERSFSPASVCGWTDGNVGSPVACGASSICMRNAVNSIVGCCSIGAVCNSSAFYTGCVDESSPWQTTSNAMVHTCTGDARCYRNTFPGGYSQYVCGSSSTSASVATTYSGMPADMQLLMAFFTSGQTVEATVTSSSTVASSTSGSSLSTDTSSSSSQSSAVKTSSSSVVTDLSNSLPTAISGGPETLLDGKGRTGLIIGGVMGSFGGVLLFAAIAAWLCHRRRSNKQFKGQFYAPPDSKQSFISSLPPSTYHESRRIEDVATRPMPFSPEHIISLPSSNSGSRAPSSLLGHTVSPMLQSTTYHPPPVYPYSSSPPTQSQPLLDPIPSMGSLTEDTYIPAPTWFRAPSPPPRSPRRIEKVEEAEAYFSARKSASIKPTTLAQIMKSTSNASSVSKYSCESGLSGQHTRDQSKESGVAFQNRVASLPDTVTGMGLGIGRDRPLVESRVSVPAPLRYQRKPVQLRDDSGVPILRMPVLSALGRGQASGEKGQGRRYEV